MAVVAAKDRADSVGETVAALRGLAGVDEVLVVDDGSTDATSAVAAQAGAWVLRLPENVGKGGAVAAGIATSSETDIYLLVDADVGVTAGAADALLEPVLAGQADLVIGVLPGAGGKGGFGLVRRLAAAGIERACGYVAQAPLSGQRAVRGELLRGLDLAPRFGLETGFTIDAVRAGARVLEVPVAMDHRHTGRRLAGLRPPGPAGRRHQPGPLGAADHGPHPGGGHRRVPGAGPAGHGLVGVALGGRHPARRPPPRPRCCWWASPAWDGTTSATAPCPTSTA